MCDVRTDQYKIRVVDFEPLHDEQRPTKIDRIESISNAIWISPFPWKVNTTVHEVISNLGTLIKLIRMNEVIGESKRKDEPPNS